MAYQQKPRLSADHQLHPNHQLVRVICYKKKDNEEYRARDTQPKYIAVHVPIWKRQLYLCPLDLVLVLVMLKLNFPTLTM